MAILETTRSRQNIVLITEQKKNFFELIYSFLKTFVMSLPMATRQLKLQPSLSISVSSTIPTFVGGQDFKQPVQCMTEQFFLSDEKKLFTTEKQTRSNEFNQRYIRALTKGIHKTVIGTFQHFQLQVGTKQSNPDLFR